MRVQGCIYPNWPLVPQKPASQLHLTTPKQPANGQGQPTTMHSKCHQLWQQNARHEEGSRRCHWSGDLGLAKWCQRKADRVIWNHKPGDRPSYQFHLCDSWECAKKAFSVFAPKQCDAGGCPNLATRITCGNKDPLIQTYLANVCDNNDCLARIQHSIMPSNLDLQWHEQCCASCDKLMAIDPRQPSRVRCYTCLDEEPCMSSAVGCQRLATQKFDPNEQLFPYMGGTCENKKCIHQGRVLTQYRCSIGTCRDGPVVRTYTGGDNMKVYSCARDTCQTMAEHTAHRLLRNCHLCNSEQCRDPGHQAPENLKLTDAERSADYRCVWGHTNRIFVIFKG